MYIDDPRFKDAHVEKMFNPKDLSYWQDWKPMDAMRSLFNEIRQRNIFAQIGVKMTAVNPHAEIIDLSNLDPKVEEHLLNILLNTNSITQIINTAMAYIAQQEKLDDTNAE